MCLAATPTKAEAAGAAKSVVMARKTSRFDMIRLHATMEVIPAGCNPAVRQHREKALTKPIATGLAELVWADKSIQ